MTKEDQLCTALKAVREVLPLPKKRVMSRSVPDFASELMCASVLLPVVGAMQKYKLHDLYERLTASLREATALAASAGSDYADCSGPKAALAIANIAAHLLSR